MDSPLRSPWQDTPATFAQRLEAVVKDINAECDVARACANFLAWLRALVDRASEQGQLLIVDEIYRDQNEKAYLYRQISQQQKMRKM